MKFRAMLMGLFFMPIVAVAIFGFTNGFEVRELKPLGHVANFNLTAHTGQEVTQDDYKDKVWIASFIFTNCDTQCPHILSALREVQKALYSKSSVRLVSISVDPERDNVENLAKHAERNGARPERWLFLTGDPKEIRTLSEKSFKLSALRDPMNAANPDDPVLHSSHLVLVDGRGYIRGYYDAMDDSKVQLLIKDAKSLIRGLSH